ncbi:MAG TPA: class I SAM-dependent methyltransferase [Polyangiaceae bacterium]|jgi:SAM-dependent methyltransferase|nr:class I SAM-dependent methyltransferase [Polyangiaceae bacterium]
MTSAMFGTDRRKKPFPLDYDERGYAYVERPNTALLRLLEDWAPSAIDSASILDVGCGAGANARAIRERHPEVRITGIEPDARAAELARQACDEVVHGTLADFVAGGPAQTFDAVILSDVLEHVPEPVRFLRELLALPGCARARYFVSVPNYAVWYNRLRTLAGDFSYAWSGLYDRTHLRFFTRRSVRQLLEHCALDVLEQRATPSLAQSAAPLLRRFFDADALRGEHLSLGQSNAFRAYSRFVEPLESKFCALWPELFAFQIVSVAEPHSRAAFS